MVLCKILDKCEYFHLNIKCSSCGLVFRSNGSHQRKPRGGKGSEEVQRQNQPNQPCYKAFAANRVKYIRFLKQLRNDCGYYVLQLAYKALEFKNQVNDFENLYTIMKAYIQQAPNDVEMAKGKIREAVTARTMSKMSTVLNTTVSTMYYIYLIFAVV